MSQAANPTCKPIDTTENQQSGHRQIVFSVESGEKKFWLKLQDTRYTWNYIPLGSVSSSAKGQHPKGANVLVPVIPLSYTTPDAAPKQAAILRKGWLYVFRNGQLWRELEVGESGYLRDVNLKHNQKKEVRQATGTFDNRVLLPYKVLGEKQAVEMAFSEIQWSWARIKKLQADASLRRQRMQEIDMSGNNAKFPTMPANGNKARIENVNKAPELYALSMQRQSNIPAVYLHDPLQVADQLVNTLAIAQLSLIDELQRVQQLETVPEQSFQKLDMDEKQAFFRAAVFTYRTWFEPANASRPIAKNGPKVNSTLQCHTQGEVKTEIGLGKDSLDKAYLETILAVASRRKIRVETRGKKKVLADYLSGKYQGKDIRANQPDLIDIPAVLCDYAALEGPGYILLWQRMNSLTGFFNHDPAVIDAIYDIPAEVAAERPAPENDPGYVYLEGLLDPGHPLHAALFPSATQIDVRTADAASTAGEKDQQPEPANGNGLFRPIAYSGSILAVRKIGPYRLAEGIIKEAEKVAADFVASFQKHWERASAGKSVAQVEAVFRLAKSADLPELKGMHLAAPGNALDGKVVIDARLRVMENLARAQRRALAQGGAKAGKGIDIVDPKTGKVIGSQDFSQIGRYQGVVKEITDNDWTGLWGETGRVNDKTRIVRTRAELVVVPETSPYAIRYHNPELAASSGVAANTSLLRGLSKTLPPLVAVIEGWNLIRSVITLRQDKKINFSKNLSTFAVAAIALPYAIVDSAIKVFGEKNVFSYLGQSGYFGNFGKKMLTSEVSIAGKNLPLYSARGASLGAGVVAGLSAIMAGWDAVDCFNQDDLDAGATFSVSAAGFAGSFLAALGGEGGIVALSFAGPWGWVFLGVGLSAGLLAIALSDSEFEKWAKHGPFAKDISSRMSHKYSGKSNAAALASLLDIFMRPRLVIRENPSRLNTTGVGSQYPEIVVEVTAPGFEVGRGTLPIHVTVEGGGKDVRGFFMGPTFTGLQQVPQTPNRVEPIYADENNLAEIGVRYCYAGQPGRWRARAQHVTAQQIVLPPPSNENKGYDPIKINHDDSGWVTALKEARYS